MVGGDGGSWWIGLVDIVIGDVAAWAWAVVVFAAARHSWGAKGLNFGRGSLVVFGSLRGGVFGGLVFFFGIV